jgi:hypothetical protein
MRHVHRHRHLFRRLIPIVLASFLCFLTQPQIATLHHDHHDGEHFHTHADLFVSFLAALTHSHHDDHDHDHGHGRAHTHAPTRPLAVSHTTLAYSHPDWLERGHWHTFTALQQPWFVSVAPQFPFWLAQCFSFQEWQSLHAAFLARFQPRAPPLSF